ncbi:MAG: GNAT family N-acetyltransferase [Nakamurella sp.]
MSVRPADAATERPAVAATDRVTHRAPTGRADHTGSMPPSAPPPLPPWPEVAPTHDGVRLRQFRDEDVAMLVDLAGDPYLALIGSLPARATREQALEFLTRQHGRLREGAGYSFCIARIDDDLAVGTTGLWLRRLDEGLGSVGYAVAPAQRGNGHARSAVLAICEHAGSITGLQELEAFVEPWNLASRRTIEGAGFRDRGQQTHPRNVAEPPVPMVRYTRQVAAEEPTGRR